MKWYLSHSLSILFFMSLGHLYFLLLLLQDVELFTLHFRYQQMHHTFEVDWEAIARDLNEEGVGPREARNRYEYLESNDYVEPTAEDCMNQRYNRDPLGRMGYQYTQGPDGDYDEDEDEEGDEDDYNLKWEDEEELEEEDELDDRYEYEEVWDDESDLQDSDLDEDENWDGVDVAQEEDDWDEDVGDVEEDYDYEVSDNNPDEGWVDVSDSRYENE